VVWLKRGAGADDRKSDMPTRSFPSDDEKEAAGGSDDRH
jgi:hypothetical protein